jgi:uncharacterized protein YndB with AHSA1/START domain
MENDNELRLEITRIFDAPRSRVWDAWTKDDQMSKWSCPNGFTTTFGESDLRVGGTFRAGMKSPEGEESVVIGTYKEIVEPERLVMSHAWEDENGKPGHETLVSVKFSEDNGKTTMHFVQTGFETVDSRNGHEAGWNESFNKLANIVN